MPIRLVCNYSRCLKIENSDSRTWKLETNNPDLVRKQLFELALQHNLNIVSLQSEEHSLEDVFRNLTGKQ